jgi:hypothetical protein
MITGSLMNPGFLVPAVKPKTNRHTGLAIRRLLACSCTLTRVGYAGAAWSVARAAALAL